MWTMWIHCYKCVKHTTYRYLLSIVIHYLLLPCIVGVWITLVFYVDNYVDRMWITIIIFFVFAQLRGYIVTLC